MKQYTLIIREVDRAIYDALKSGKKRVETRANSPKFAKIEVGDVLVFKCGEDSFDQQITSIKRFADINEMLDCYQVQDINPKLQTRDQLVAMYHSFPDYDEKIRQFGLIAFELS